MSRFSPSWEYAKKCDSVTQKFMKFFERFFDISKKDM